MPKIKDLSIAVKAAITEWESIEDEDIQGKAEDKFQYLEMLISELADTWYQETTKGRHHISLETRKQLFKDQAHHIVTAIKKRENSQNSYHEADFKYDTEFQKQYICHLALKLYNYAKSI